MKRRSVWVVECLFENDDWAPMNMAYTTEEEALKHVSKRDLNKVYRVVRYDASE